MGLPALHKGAKMAKSIRVPARLDSGYRGTELRSANRTRSLSG